MTHTVMSNNDEIELKHLEMYKEKDTYYLKAVYEHTTKYRKERLIIPKIILPVNPKNVIINHATCYNHEANVNIGFGNLPILEKDGFSYIVKILEEYPQKMTLEEIEKKLGYKVEIVSKK
jgi:hypothetical protein